MIEPSAPRALDTALLAERISALRWYHRMDLNGVMTPGISDVSRGLPRLHLPASFAGQSVLDVGAWDGFYSFEAARRDATRVLATDSFAWDGSCWGTDSGFLLARGALGMDELVEDQMIDVMELNPDALGGTFDVTFFLGVLYHLRDPITALERVASVTSDLLVLETETALNWLPTPVARVYPAADLNDDDTNYFAFNLTALRQILIELGFSNVEVRYRTSLARRLARASVGVIHRRRFASTLRSARIVLHARR